jgi:hypothetical protein
MSRVNLSPRPEYLEDAIRRLRTFALYPSSDEDHTKLTRLIDIFTHQRFQYFGVTGNSRGTPPNPSMNIRAITNSFGVRLPKSEDWSQMQKKLDHLRDVTDAILNGEITDVEAAVERSRKLIPLQQSSDQWSLASDAR